MAIPEQNCLISCADEGQGMARVLLGIVIAVMMVDAALFFWALGTFQPVDKWGMFRISAIGSVAIWGAAIWFVWFFLRGHLRISKDLAIAFFLSIPVFLAAGFIGMMALNGSLDASGPQQYEVQVTDKGFSRGRHGNSYYLKVSRWREGSASYQFPVGCGVYDQAIVGQSCLITTRQGALGFEWVAVNSCR